MQRARWAVRIGWVAAAAAFAWVLTHVLWSQWGPEWAVPCYPGQGEGPGFHPLMLCLAGPPLVLGLAAMVVASALGWRLTRPLTRSDRGGSLAARIWLLGAGGSILVFVASVIMLFEDRELPALGTFGFSVLMTVILAGTFKRAFGQAPSRDLLVVNR